MESITIIIADSQNLYKIGLKSVIKKHFKNAKIKETTSKNELFRWFSKEDINYLFLDPNNIKNLNVEDIVNLNNQYPNCKIIINACSSHEVSEHLLFQKIVKGYICKSNSQHIFEEAISKIEDEQAYVCKEILAKIVNDKIEKTKEVYYQLTERETEIIKLIGKGKSGDQIAQELFISVHTFRTHRKNIMKKTKMNSTSKLVLYAINQNLI